MKATAKGFIEEMADRGEHLKLALFGGVTKQGTYILATQHGMDLKTLIEIRKMITGQIKDMREGRD